MTDVLRAYLAERYPAPVFVPFSVAIVACGFVAFGEAPSVARALVAMALAYTLVLSFRLWDDRADLESDRVHGPGRVMVRAESMRPFAILAVALVVVVAALLVIRRAVLVDLIALALAGAGLGAWYRRRVRVPASALANAHVLACKYPLIAMVSVAPLDRWRAVIGTPSALAPLLALYLALCAYDTLSDARVRVHGAASWTLAGELALLGAIPLLALTGGLSR